MSTIQEKQLGQSRPSGTSAVSIYSPAADTTWIGKTMLICNTTAGAVAFSVYHDEDGTTYDQSTALFYTVPLSANETMNVSLFIAGSNSSGNVAVQTDTANAITFTMYGAEIT